MIKIDTPKAIPVHSEVRTTGLVLLHLADRRRRVVEPSEVFFLEAVGARTLVRLRGRERLEDLRRLGHLLPLFEPFGFHRVHKNHAVNLHRVFELRPRSRGVDWELKLEPPVNRVLPIARGELAGVLAAYGS